MIFLFFFLDLQHNIIIYNSVILQFLLLNFVKNYTTNLNPFFMKVLFLSLSLLFVSSSSFANLPTKNIDDNLSTKTEILESKNKKPLCRVSCSYNMDLGDGSYYTITATGGVLIYWMCKSLI